MEREKNIRIDRMGTGPCRPFLWLAACTLALSLTGCSHEVEDTPRYSGESIQLNMLAGSTREAGIESNALNWGPTLFFFTEAQYNQAAPTETNAATPSLTSTDCTYLLSAPEDVDTYSSALYDTGKKYPADGSSLYAAGYAPTGMLKPDNGNHATLRVDYGGEEYDFLAGSIDFLGCDANPAYCGSSGDPFGQPTNVLKFRHLTSKITFYAYRSAEMENKQYVRNVAITGLQMQYQSTDEFFKLHTPTEFTWSAPEKTSDDDEAGQKHWGYKITDSKVNPNTSWIESGKTDGLLVGEERATILSSIYACDPYPHTVNDNDQLVLQMTVWAELSPDPAFPEEISKDKTWENMTVGIMEFKNNKATGNPVRNFRPGHEYKVYLQFKPTGVFLQGVGLPWIEEGPHYVPITPVSK